MNVWRLGPLNRNPYYRNAFRVSRVPREVVRLRDIAILIQTTRKVARDPDAHHIAGEPVSPAEINAAEATLADAGRRIHEELLAHAEEPEPWEPLRKQEDLLRSLMMCAEPLTPAGDATWAAGLAGALLRQFRAAPLGEPFIGALELDLEPPFGGGPGKAERTPGTEP